MKYFGFVIGKRLINVKARTEQNALCNLIKSKEGWELIDKEEKIILYGEMKK